MCFYGFYTYSLYQSVRLESNICVSSFNVHVVGPVYLYRPIDRYEKYFCNQTLKIVQSQVCQT